MRESRVEQHLVKRVKALGGETRKLAWFGRHSAPDRLVLLPNWPPTLVELKRPGKAATAAQAREHATLWRFGFPVLVLSSIEAVDEFIRLRSPHQ